MQPASPHLQQPQSHDDDALETERPSKTRRKLAMKGLQQLGESLLGLPAAVRARLPLTEALRDALEAAARVRGREGMRRHLQYIGRLMRDADSDAIAAALADIEAEHLATTRAATRAATRTAAGKSS